MGTQPTEVVTPAPAASFPTFAIALIVVAVMIVVVAVLVVVVVILVVMRRPSAAKKSRCVHSLHCVHILCVSVAE